MERAVPGLRPRGGPGRENGGAPRAPGRHRRSCPSLVLIPLTSSPPSPSWLFPSWARRHLCWQVALPWKRLCRRRGFTWHLLAKPPPHRGNTLPKNPFSSPISATLRPITPPLPPEPPTTALRGTCRQSHRAPKTPFPSPIPAPAALRPRYLRCRRPRCAPGYFSASPLARFPAPPRSGWVYTEV